jgi:uncharacterized repeat protein (TIGR02543 family)
VRTGYTFTNWYADRDLTTPWDFDRIVSSVSITLYAAWIPVTYPIVYHLNGGAQNPGNPASYTIETPAITLAAPSRPGCTFGGWSDNSNFLGSPVSGIPAGSTGGRSLHAKWDVITYQIAYALNGGQNSPDNPAQYTVESSAIIFQSPGRWGYTFAGWYDNPDLSGVPVTNLPNDSTGDISLYAAWTLDVYPIEYILSGGTNNPGNAASYTVYDAVTLLNPEYPGYAFAGWFDNAGFLGSPIAVIPEGSTGALKFFARWTKGVSFSAARERIDRFSGDPKIF